MPKKVRSMSPAPVEENDGKGDFRYDERRPQFAVAQAGSGTGPGPGKTGMERPGNGVNRWNESAENCGEKRERHGREQNDPIQLDHGFLRKTLVRDQRNEFLDSQVSKKTSGGAAQSSEDEAFDQQLPDQAPARRAQGRAHGYLAVAGGGAGKEQARHVGARDQEQQHHRAQQRRKNTRKHRRHARLKRPRRHPELLRVMVRIGLGQPVSYDVHIGSRFWNRRASVSACRAARHKRPSGSDRSRSDHDPSGKQGRYPSSPDGSAAA